MPPRPSQQQKPLACTNCRLKKARCDRIVPTCTPCVEAGEECLRTTARKPYEGTKRRLRKIVVEAARGDRRDVPESGLKLPYDNTTGRPNFTADLWTGLDHELQEHGTPETTKGEVMAVGASVPIDLGSVGAPPSFVRPIAPPSTSLSSLLPSVGQAHKLWQAFLTCVNPLTKVVHVPTVQSLVAARDVDSSLVLAPSQAALLFAMHAAGAMALTDADCASTFPGETPRAVLLGRVAAAEVALARAGLLRNPFIPACPEAPKEGRGQGGDLVLLQALVLYVLCVRSAGDAHAAWLLTGMALRMGRGMGLHTTTGGPSSVLDAQMRLRVWWQLLVVEVRGAQLAGMTPSSGEAMDSARTLPLPRDVDDADLTAGATSHRKAKRRRGPSEMLFPLMRYELTAFWARQGDRLVSRQRPRDSQGVELTPDDKDALVDELEDRLESTYVRYCDPADAVHLIAVGGLRVALAKLRLTVHHPANYRPRQSTGTPDAPPQPPDGLHARLLTWSSTMVRYNVLGLTATWREPMAPFAWHVDAHLFLDAFAFMLVELRHCPLGTEADKAWELAGEMFRLRPELVSGAAEADDAAAHGEEATHTGERRAGLHEALRRLALEAWAARDTALLQPRARPAVISVSWPLPTPPPFLEQLRAAAAGKSRAVAVEHLPLASSDAALDEADQGAEDDGAFVVDQAGFANWADADDWDFWNMLPDVTLRF